MKPGRNTQHPKHTAHQIETPREEGEERERKKSNHEKIKRRKIPMEVLTLGRGVWPGKRNEISFQAVRKKRLIARSERKYDDGAPHAGHTKRIGRAAMEGVDRIIKVVSSPDNNN